MKILIYMVGMLLFWGCDSEPEAPPEPSASDCSMRGSECADGFTCVMGEGGGYSCLLSSEVGGAEPGGDEPSAGMGYEINGVQFRMRGIPAGDGVASFLMAETEVTQELYEAVMGSNPSDFTGDDQRPVETVSWEDAIVFCNTLSGLLGLTPVYQGTDNDATMNENANGFRLPFESEWEWAARGGQNFTYAGSDNLDDVGWYDGNSGDTTHPVGRKQANGYGLFDLSGNVWEWTNDDYDNPGVYRSGAGGRVLRGGSWYYYAGDCELSDRGRSSPGSRNGILGLRLSRSL